MRFVVVGPGALGCLMATRLAEAAAKTGDALWILDHDPERAGLIGYRGLIYQKLDNRRNYPVDACADPSAIGRADVLFLCVKSYDLRAALSLCRPLLRSGTLAIFMQNGIAHLGLTDLAGAAAPVYGCTSEGATSLGAGQVRHAGDGATHLGFLENCGEAATELLAQTVSVLRAGGLAAFVSEDILTRLWAKLFVNVGINALTAIHDCPNGDLLTLPGVGAEMKAAVEEARRVAEAKGIAVDTDPYRTTVEVCRATAANISSMRQDVLKKRPTEIEAINGAVAREAAGLSIPTPVNDMLVERIKAIEQRYGTRGSGEDGDDTDIR